MTKRAERCSTIRTRWAALGAAVAVTLGGGGIGLVSAAVSTGERTTFVAIDACRVVDVRPEFQVGPKSSPLGPGETLTVSAHGDNGECSGIPSDAVALSLNITAVGATAPTFLTVWSAGGPRPVASSLNPSPGAPPTPNAVTTRLSPAGQFNIYNLAGDVDVLADINGYFVDHDHDDRYDTSAEVDAKIDARAALGPTLIELNMIDLAPLRESSGWTRESVLVHAPSMALECVVASFDAVAGQRITGARATYLNESGGSIEVLIQVLGLKITPGPIPAGESDLVHTAVHGTQVLAVSPGAVLEETILTAEPDNVVRDGFRYSAALCTEDAIAVTGVRITLEHP